MSGLPTMCNVVESDVLVKTQARLDGAVELLREAMRNMKIAIDHPCGGIHAMFETYEVIDAFLSEIQEDKHA